MTVTSIYLLRHGETEGAESRRYKGHIDVPLSEHGVHQVHKVANRLLRMSKNRLHAVYCSDLQRAVKSAEIIAAPFGLRPVLMSELKERSFGLWEGMTFEEIGEQYPDAFSAWANDPLRFSPENGETTEQARERAMRAFDLILRRHPGETVAVVTHGGITRILLCEFLGVPLQNLFRIEQDFSALNVIEFHDGCPVVKRMNCTDALVTG